MDANFFSEDAKRQREERALAEHEYMSKLFKENRFTFEQRRKRLIDECINNVDDERLKEKLKQTQDKINHVMNRAKTPHNRLLLMKMLFLDQVYNEFLPALHMIRDTTQDIKQELKPKLKLV